MQVRADAPHLRAGQRGAPATAKRSPSGPSAARHRRRAAGAPRTSAARPPDPRAAAPPRARRRPRRAARSRRPCASCAARRAGRGGLAARHLDQTRAPPPRCARRRAAGAPAGRVPRLPPGFAAEEPRCGGTRSAESTRTRTGRRTTRSPRRAVSSGSSAQRRAGADHHGVRAARAGGAPARATPGPLIQRDSPRAVAMRPSSVLASFSATKGRPRAQTDRKPRCCSRHSASSTPTVHRDARAAQPREAAARDGGCGSTWPTSTRRSPAATARVGAGRRAAVWSQGSSVTASDAPRSARAPWRALRAADRDHLRVRPAGGCVAPRRRARGRRGTRRRRRADSARLRPRARRAQASASRIAASGVIAAFRGLASRGQGGEELGVVLGVLEVEEDRREARGRQRVDARPARRARARRRSGSRPPSRRAPGPRARRDRPAARSSSAETGRLSQAFPNAAISFSRSNSSRRSSRFTTFGSTSSTRSRVVKRRPHSRHSRRRRISAPSRPSRESITLFVSSLQKGQRTAQATSLPAARIEREAAAERLDVRRGLASSASTSSGRSSARAISAAISAISGSRMPRVVTAGVPMRTPEVTAGLRGSKGTMFLLVGDAGALRARPAPALPVISRSDQREQEQVVSVPPETTRKPRSRDAARERARVGDDLRAVGAEGRRARLLEAPPPWRRSRASAGRPARPGRPRCRSSWRRRASHRIMPPRGPRSVLCVVVVTIVRLADRARVQRPSRPAPRCARCRRRARAPTSSAIARKASKSSMRE